MQRLTVPSVFFALLFAITFAGNWKGICRTVSRATYDASAWNGRDYHGNGEHADAFRELAEGHVKKGERLYYRINSTDGKMSPAERSTHIALSWAMSPVPVDFGSSDDASRAYAIIASRFLKADFPGYWLAAENDSAALWLRGDVADEGGDREGSDSSPSPCRESAGALVVCVLISALVCLLSRRTESLHGNVAVNACCTVLFFALASAIALTHTFVSPTGLGVYGGKAKLFFMGGGIPDGFFTDGAYSSYQPAYPPGLTLLTLVAYVISGCCGEWLTQLIPVFAATMTMWLVVRIGNGSHWGQLLAVAAFLGEQTLQMTTMFYAEPLVAMFAILGWLRLRKDRWSFSGWTLLGTAGLFKTEALILTVAIWMAFGIHALMASEFRLTGDRWHRCLAWTSRLAVAVALPLLWHCGCRLAGASFYDYAPVWDPDFSRFCKGAAYLLKTAFLEPWRYGFAYPLAIAVVSAAMVRRAESAQSGSQTIVAALAALSSMVIFAFVYSLSRAPDFRWHLWSSAARLLWTPSLFILLECAANASHDKVLNMRTMPTSSAP